MICSKYASQAIIVALSFSLPYFIASCNKTIDYTKEISMLDSTIAKLTIAEAQLTTNDSTTLLQSYNFTKEHLTGVAEKLSKDIVRKKTGIFILNIYDDASNIQNLLDNKKHLLRAIRKTHQRIIYLQHDLQKSILKKKSANEFVTTEINTAEKIIQLTIKSLQKANQSVHNIDSLKTQIIFLSDSLKGITSP